MAVAFEQDFRSGHQPQTGTSGADQRDKHAGIAFAGFLKQLQWRYTDGQRLVRASRKDDFLEFSRQQMSMEVGKIDVIAQLGRCLFARLLLLLTSQAFGGRPSLHLARDETFKNSFSLSVERTHQASETLGSQFEHLAHVGRKQRDTHHLVGTNQQQRFAFGHRKRRHHVSTTSIEFGRRMQFLGVSLMLHH